MSNSIKDIIFGYLTIARDRTIVIYGMGKVGSLLYDEIKLKNPICVDNNKVGFERSGILGNNVNKYYVIVSPLYTYEEIEVEIQSYGYREIQDYVCLGKLRPAHDWMLKNIQTNKFSGDYTNWNEVESTLKNGFDKGYAEDRILNKVLNATQSIRNGKAAYERDSVLFYEESWNAHFIAALYYITNTIGKRDINVLDFGGALGSTYFQHERLFNNINWSIIEQKEFVDIGKKVIPEVQFYYDIHEYVDMGNMCDVLFMSSVLMYLNEPYFYLESLLNASFKFVVIDRTYFNIVDNDRLCLQTVPDEIYTACYPAWLLSEKKINKVFEEHGYKKIISWYSTLENEEKEYMPLENEHGDVLLPGKGYLYILDV